MYVHRLIWEHAETIREPRRSCLAAEEYRVERQIRELLPGTGMFIGTIYIRRLLFKSEQRYRVDAGKGRRVRVTGADAAARCVVRWRMEALRKARAA